MGDRHGPLRTPGRGDRGVPVVLHVRRGPPHAQLARRAGPAPGRRRRLRMAGRGMRSPLGMVRTAPCGGHAPTRWSTSSRPCSGTTTRAASSPPGATPKLWWSAPRNSPTAPSRPPTRSPSPPSPASMPSSTTTASATPSNAPSPWLARSSSATRPPSPIWWPRSGSGPTASRSSSPENGPTFSPRCDGAGFRTPWSSGANRTAAPLCRTCRRRWPGLRLPIPGLRPSRERRPDLLRTVGLGSVVIDDAPPPGTVDVEPPREPRRHRSHDGLADEAPRRPPPAEPAGRTPPPTRHVSSAAQLAAANVSRPQADRRCTSWSCPPPPRTPRSSTWPPAPSCASGSRGPRVGRIDAAPSGPVLHRRGHHGRRPGHPYRDPRPGPVA